jgi:hypothetical protein
MTLVPLYPTPISVTKSTTRQASGDVCAEIRKGKATTPSRVEMVKLVSRVMRSEI